MVSRDSLKLNTELRAEAREVLQGQWWPALGACLVVSLIMGFASSVAIASLIIGGAFELGLMIFFINLSRTRTNDFNDIFRGFDYFGKSLGLYLLTMLFVFLWSLLFIIPGIIASIRYSMAFYILADNPELTAQQALDRSKEMMQGVKAKYFWLMLSFIGWSILCLFTFGIGFLFLAPYIRASKTAFYEDIRRNEVRESAA